MKDSIVRETKWISFTVFLYGILMICNGYTEWVMRGIQAGGPSFIGEPLFHERMMKLFFFLGMFHCVGNLVFSKTTRWGNLILLAQVLGGILLVGRVLIGVPFQYSYDIPDLSHLQGKGIRVYTSFSHVLSVITGLFLIRLYIKRILGAQH